MSKKHHKKRSTKLCNDQCENCLYVGEGDFMCEILEKFVIEDFEPVVYTCQCQDEDDEYDF